jgi:acetylornithine deacetylase
MKTDSKQLKSVLAGLVEIQSFTGQTSSIVEHLQNQLELLGYQVSVEKSTPDWRSRDFQGSPPFLLATQRPEYIIAYPPRKYDSGLLLFAHYDTETLTRVSASFNLIEDELKFYGHGIADDKAGIAAILLAVENLNLLNCKNLPAVVFAQSKQGGSFGMSEAIANVKNRIAAIYAHPAESNQGFGQIKTASRGIATFRLEFKGLLPSESEENTPASADPRQGQSAVLSASEFISQVHNWNDPDIVWLATGISSQNKSFQVPVLCEVLISVWFKRFSTQEVATILAERLAVFTAKLNLAHQPLLKMLGIRANPAVTRDQKFIEKVKAIITQHTSQYVAEYDWHAASDIRFPVLHLDIPAVGLGCIAGGFYGGAEWVDKESFKQFIEILIQLSRDIP